MTIHAQTKTGDRETKHPQCKRLFIYKIKQKYLPFPSLAEAESAGEDSLGLLAEGGPDSRTFSAIILPVKILYISTKIGVVAY